MVTNGYITVGNLASFMIITAYVGTSLTGIISLIICADKVARR
jgi:hypothetical protein